MTPSHPVLLGVAVVVALFFAWPLFQFFFDSPEQFREDAELDTPQNRLITGYFLAVGERFRSDHLNLNIIVYLLVMAAIVAAAYHCLVYVAAWFV